jgi:hypothetical protein
LESKFDFLGEEKIENYFATITFFGNLSDIWLVSRSSSDHRPPAALLSNIGPARIPSPPLEARRAILHRVQRGWIP